jgi:CRP-like cAMP-binding protein
MARAKLTNNVLNVLGENRVLAGLPQRDYRRLAPELEELSLNTRASLYEPNKRIDYVYFPLSGVLSVIVDLQSGSKVEVGTVGNEGMLGTPLFLGSDLSPLSSFVQVASTSLRMSASTFKKETSNGGPLFERARLHTLAWFHQVAQSTACNSRHPIEQRMCRWLLMTRDRVGTHEFYLTQEFLAQMLGVRRASVTIVAGLLQRAGLIRYGRGRITIEEPLKLEAASCECYESVRNEYLRLLA